MLEPYSLRTDHLQGFLIVLLVLLFDLHVELTERVDIPDRNILFHLSDTVNVTGSQHTETETGNTIGFGNTLHNKQMWISSNDILLKECAVLSIRKIDK